jgi:hypothetical protein
MDAPHDHPPRDSVHELPLLLDHKSRYEEAGRFHRYILNWRHGAFVGFLVATYNIVQLSFEYFSNDKMLAGAALLMLAILGSTLRVIDQRIRRLYFLAQTAAAEMEQGRTGGFYTRLLNDNTPDVGTPGPHTETLWSIYSGASWLFGLGGWFLIMWGVVDRMPAG